MNIIEYDTRVVAFIDILGFKAHIIESIKNTNKLSKIYYATHFMNDEQNNNINNKFNRKATSFSDSIVISYPMDLKKNIIEDIINIQILLTNYGLLLRGGIAHGKLYHDGQVVFGSAMIEAYELESNLAKYPRIILSEEYFNLLNQYNSNKNFINKYLIKDNDGFYYLNFLHHDGNENDFQNKKEIFINLEKHINEVLNNNQYQKPDIKAKMYWLQNYLCISKDKYQY